jgi:hypothetical protein
MGISWLLHSEHHTNNNMLLMCDRSFICGTVFYLTGISHTIYLCGDFVRGTVRKIKDFNDEMASLSVPFFSFVYFSAIFGVNSFYSIVQ